MDVNDNDVNLSWADVQLEDEDVTDDFFQSSRDNREAGDGDGCGSGDVDGCGRGGGDCVGLGCDGGLGGLHDDGCGGGGDGGGGGCVGGGLADQEDSAGSAGSAADVKPSQSSRGTKPKNKGGRPKKADKDKAKATPAAGNVKATRDTRETFEDILESWQGGENGFNQWLKDVEPRILVRNGQTEVFSPTDEQARLIKETLRLRPDGGFQRSISLSIQPRRHGKSTVNTLIVLWLFTSRRNFTVQLLGASEDHCRRTMFNRLKFVVNATPKLAAMIPPESQYGYRLDQLELGNTIQYAASAAASMFGDRINLLWVSDLHAFADLGAFNALQASLLDSQDSLLLIDSNTDTTDGPVHSLQKEAKNDAGMYADHVHYKDIEEFCAKAPGWIDRDQARRLERTSLPADFRRDILGQRSDAKNALFAAEIIERAKTRYRFPVDDISTLTNGRSYVIGGGLDRAKSLIAGPRGDSTIWTVVAKVATPGGEPEFFILNQTKFLVNTAEAIKAKIAADHRKYGLKNITLENYETSDLYGWLVDKQIPVELLTAGTTVQNAAFPEMFRIFNEGRFHFPVDLPDLASELGTFSYERHKNGLYSFGHAMAKFHDDRVYSTCWAVYSLRKEVLNLYSIDSIVCQNRNSARREACFLMGGGFELHCSRDCPAAVEVKDLFRQFQLFNFDSDLTLSNFFKLRVKVRGAVIYQSV